MDISVKSIKVYVNLIAIYIIILLESSYILIFVVLCPPAFLLGEILKVIYILFGMNNYVLIWGDWLS